MDGDGHADLLWQNIAARRLAFDLGTLYDAFPKSQQLAANEAFLDGVIQLGLNVLVVTKGGIIQRSSALEWEATYFISKVYKWSEEGTMLVAPTKQAMTNSLISEVEAALKSLAHPPEVVGSTDPESAHCSTITLRDADLVWTVVRERGRTTLLAAPTFAASDSFDFDLLWRFVFGPEGSKHNIEAGAISSLIAIIPALHKGLRRALREENWPDVRDQLIRSGHERNARDFGTPI